MRKKTFFGFLALIIATGIVIACGIGSQVDGHWFQNPNVETWFHSWGAEKQPEDKISILAYTLSADEYEAYGIDPQAVTEAKVLSIDFEPTNTSDKRINWHVKFKNENSAWARGKNALDYVQFVPAANYGSTATIGIKQPFGETILVEACSRSNPSLKATINVERVARLGEIWYGSEYEISLDEWNNKTPIDLFKDIDIYETSDGYSADYDCNLYTVLPDEFRGTVRFEQNSDLYNFIRDSNHDDGDGTIEEVDIKYLTNWNDYFTSCFQYGEGKWASNVYVADSKVSEYMLSQHDFFGTVYFKLEYYYQGERIGSFETLNDVMLSLEFINAFAVPATSLTPNPDKVIF